MECGMGHKEAMVSAWEFVRCQSYSRERESLSRDQAISGSSCVGDQTREDGRLRCLRRSYLTANGQSLSFMNIYNRASL